MRKSLIGYLLITIGLAGLSWVNYLFEVFEKVPCNLILFFIFIVVSAIALIWDCNCDYYFPQSIEGRHYPTCVEIIINGKHEYRFGQREKFYEDLLKYGLHKVWLCRNSNVFGMCSQIYPVMFPKRDTTTEHTNWVIVPSAEKAQPLDQKGGKSFTIDNGRRINNG